MHALSQSQICHPIKSNSGTDTREVCPSFAHHAQEGGSIVHLTAVVKPSQGSQMCASSCAHAPIVVVAFVTATITARRKKGRDVFLLFNFAFDGLHHKVQTGGRFDRIALSDLTHKPKQHIIQICNASIVQNKRQETVFSKNVIRPVSAAIYQSILGQWAANISSQPVRQGHVARRSIVDELVSYAYFRV